MTEATEGYLNKAVSTLKKQLHILENKLSTIDLVVLDEARHREELAVITMERVAELTDTMQRYIKTVDNMNPNQQANLIHRQAGFQRSRERRNFIESIKEMEGLTRKRVKSKCACGKHYGLSFYNGREKVIDSMCPMEWWRLSSHVANFEGTLSEFLKAHPWNKINKENLLEDINE